MTTLKQLRQENRKLSEENARLRLKLPAFHLGHQQIPIQLELHSPEKTRRFSLTDNSFMDRYGEWVCAAMAIASCSLGLYFLETA